MKASLAFRLTAIAVFIQIALGGLVTFEFVPPEIHMIVGFAVLAMAIVSAYLALTRRPAFRPIRGLSIGLVTLVIAQILLGFTTLATGNDIIAWIHLLIAMGIYGMAVSGTFMATRWDNMPQPAMAFK